MEAVMKWKPIEQSPAASKTQRRIDIGALLLERI
jgi:hypothetical protein